MLQILPVKDKETQKLYCEKLGIEYDADQMAYAAFDNEEFRGISLFRILGKDCVIYSITLCEGINDHLARYLLAKAPMNFADLCGIKTAIYKDADTALAKELGFTEDCGVLKVNLEGYFTTPCKGHGCKE